MDNPKNSRKCKAISEDINEFLSDSLCENEIPKGKTKLKRQNEEDIGTLLLKTKKIGSNKKEIRNSEESKIYLQKIKGGMNKQQEERYVLVS